MRRVIEIGAVTLIVGLLVVIASFLAEHNRRLEALERRLPPIAIERMSEAPAVETPAERAARYERLLRAAEDGAAAARYVTERRDTGSR